MALTRSDIETPPKIVLSGFVIYVINSLGLVRYERCIMGDLWLFYILQILVLGNKRDLPSALDEKQLIEKM